MMNKQKSNSPTSAGERLPPRERQARIASLKKDAPSLGKRDRQASVRSMTGAVFAAVGVMGIVYAMGILDSVDRRAGDEPHLQRVDTIDVVPELRVDVLIARIEREAAEAEAQRRQEWEDLLDLSAMITVEAFDFPEEAEASVPLRIPVNSEIHNPSSLAVPKIGIDDLNVWR